LVTNLLGAKYTAQDAKDHTVPMMEAMLKMKKISIAELERAADGR